MTMGGDVVYRLSTSKEEVEFTGGCVSPHVSVFGAFELGEVCVWRERGWRSVLFPRGRRRVGGEAEGGGARVVGSAAFPDGESDGHVFAEGRGGGVEDVWCLLVDDDQLGGECD